MKYTNWGFNQRLRFEASATAKAQRQSDSEHSAVGDPHQHK